MALFAARCPSLVDLEGYECLLRDLIDLGCAPLPVPALPEFNRGADWTEAQWQAMLANRAEAEAVYQKVTRGAAA